jgi:hypothetical protein
MLKKEFRDTVRRLMECLLLLLAVPIAYATDRFVVRFGTEFTEIAEFVTMAVVVIFAFYAGATVFQAEKRDRAFEYLFSLPLTRRRILGYKLLPRLAAILILVLLLIPFLGGSDAARLGIALFLLFLLALFLSIPVNSVVICFFGVGMLFYLFSLSSQMFYYLMIHLWRQNLSPYNPREQYSSMILAALLLLSPLSVAFWKTFKNLDLKPLRRQLKPYLMIALPSILIIITLAVLFFDVYLKWFYDRM